MSFIRPEAQMTLMRWREVLVGMTLDLGGLVLVLGPGRARLVIGVLMMLLGTALTFVGIQRARFRGKGGGAGLVELDERQITYFGPEMGGVLALEDLTRISVVPPHAWELTDINFQRLTIPVDAEGTEALFDAFTALPGLSVSKLADAAQTAPPARTIIWSKPHIEPG